MKTAFWDCAERPNQPIFNFFEESLYFDGLSNLLGYRRVEKLSTILDPWIRYKRIALTIIKILIYYSFPILIPFSLTSKAICRYSLSSVESIQPKTQVKAIEPKGEKDRFLIDERNWLNNQHLGLYSLFLQEKYGPEVFFPFGGWTYVFPGLTDRFFKEDSYHILDVRAKRIKSFLDYKSITYPLFIGGNHWGLLFIDREKRTVEYYDSKINYGNYEEGLQGIKDVAAKFTKYDPGEKPYTYLEKIKKKLQPDGYQCGPWALYFLEHRLENPEVDFNQLDLNEAQNMIAKYRFAVRDKLLELQKNGNTLYC
ncbi:deubiquitinase and deneddylase ChlaDub2 [Simkania negevensis]|uniref:DeSUMOylase CE1 n=1 Tax=Simkania negevensis (strain ATCC VR-1471 / DSM 27360 / Z) TaxID=331113 RepID=DUBC1_SIMNZ|nr:deubiquitinase and deneddylase ChlaDub2 [Simkania negevensis]MCB1066550.1 hypothetical protein [Simkania sp.]MCB1074605.1 hypothetical protein [Simkania sp.]MCP5490507.1 hypothetical protein [Chlamydiales bacterium]CCB88971.1 deubiquitinase and deneddylase ChlaDub2 [Simkania negevensis Z]